MADWLDGPKFVAWLEGATGFTAEPHGASVKRRVTDWKAGAPVSIWKADDLLTHLGLHLSQVPDELWIDGRHRREAVAKKPRPLYPTKLRTEVVKRRLSGVALKRLTLETGISEGTIKRWTRESRRKAEQIALSGSASDRQKKI